MNIVYICHYFAPEVGAPSARGMEHCRYWAKQGHQVKVVTCFPNHPTGRIPAHYKGKKMAVEETDGFVAYRNYVYATPNEGFIKKILGHLSFMFSAVLFSLKPVGKTDVVVVSSPTFFSIFSAFVYKIVKRAPLVLDIRDLWPAAIVELGVLKNSLIVRILEAMELYFYRKADKVIVVTERFKENIMARGIPGEKIKVITNGVDAGFFKFIPEERLQLRAKYNLDGKFIALYIGALGISQALEKLVDVAKIFEDKAVSDFVLLFVGEGAVKQKLIKYAEGLNLRNVAFLPSQEKDLMPGFYSMADVCLVPLKNVELFETFIPSKMFEIMACQRAIVASVAGEAAAILERSGGAVVTKPEDTEGVFEAVKGLMSDPVQAEIMGRAGRKYVMEHYSRQKLAEEYLQLLLKVAEDAK